jgi:hypothetical protein
MKTDCDIAVVGAGPVGAATACGLAAAGFSVALIDTRAPLPPPQAGPDYDLRVFAVSRASQRLLQSLGVWEAIAAVRVSPYRHMTVWDAHGRVDFDAADVAEPDLGHIVENRVIQAALHQCVQAMAGIDWLAPDTVERLHLDKDKATLGLAHHGRLRARLVVGGGGGGGAPPGGPPRGGAGPRPPASGSGTVTASTRAGQAAAALASSHDRVAASAGTSLMKGLFSMRESAYLYSVTVTGDPASRPVAASGITT